MEILCLCPPENSWGYLSAVLLQPHLLEEGVHPVLPLALGHVLVDHERLTYDVEDRHPGVKRAVGVLEDHLHVPSEVLLVL